MAAELTYHEVATEADPGLYLSPSGAYAALVFNRRYATAPVVWFQEMDDVYHQLPMPAYQGSFTRSKGQYKWAVQDGRFTLTLLPPAVDLMSALVKGRVHDAVRMSGEKVQLYRNPLGKVFELGDEMVYRGCFPVEGEFQLVGSPLPMEPTAFTTGQYTAPFIYYPKS